MSKKAASQERKARLEEIQKQQKAKERKVVIGIVVGCLVLLAGLGGVIAYAVSDAKSQQLPNLGAAAAAASCDPVVTDDAEGTGEHIGPGTPKATQTEVEYETVPPSSGPHFAAPEVSSRKFYTAADRPPLETLVHNLEHGYTVLWYDGDRATDQALLRDIADQANKQPQARDKFLVVEWDKARGEFPEDKPYALAHWTKDDGGKRQLCGEVSGEVIVDFIEQFPASDTPEPGAA